MESEIEMVQSIEANSADKLTSFEYEAEHFGFTPITFINGVFNSVCELYKDALVAFCSKLLEKYPGVMTEEAVNEARRKIGQKIDEDVSDLFDKLEHFLLKSTSMFSLAPSVVLPKDACQLSKKTPEEQEAMKSRKLDLNRRIIAVKYANAVLTRQLQQAEKFCELLKEQEKSILTSVKDGSELKDVLSYLSDSLLSHSNKQ